MPLNYRFYRLQATGHSLLARITRKRCFGYPNIKAHLEGKSGLEFGGPSSIFCANQLVPLYEIVTTIDLCDFSEQTIWSSRGEHFRFGSKLGKRLIMEAHDASGIGDESYEFVAASHVLEHVANPLRALQEWKRILKPSGSILVVVPHKTGTFDHRRPFTTFDHIKADFELNMSEGDMSHLEEIIELHDLALDPPAGSLEQFRNRCIENISNRAMHHHVFSAELLIQMFDYCGMEVINVAVERPYHIVVLAKKVESGEFGRAKLRNECHLDIQAEWRKSDPFRKAGESRSNRLGNLPMLSRSTL